MLWGGSCVPYLLPDDISRAERVMALIPSVRKDDFLEMSLRVLVHPVLLIDATQILISAALLNLHEKQYVWAGESWNITLYNSRALFTS